MPLTEAAVRAARAREKPYKLYDVDGLFLLIPPSGSPGWRFKYFVDGREKLISFGSYPEVSLKRARERRNEARRLVTEGVDPSAKRKAEKAARSDSFEAIAREWLELSRQSLAPVTRTKREARFERFIFPRLGKMPIAKVTAPDLLGALRQVEAQGKHETAHRLRSESGAIFRYAIATGRAERDPSVDLRGALAPTVVRNRAALTDPARVGELLRHIDGYVGQPTTQAALKLAPYVFVRPGELRKAEWRELDLEGGLWRIPGRRMKMREPFVVPLSRQAVAILRALEPVTGPDGLVFPGLVSPTRPISENTVNLALRRLGYSGDDMCGHGFRTMFSTLANEQGWSPDLIELQLDHVERDEVRSAYNRAQRLPERRRMMQAWADYLDTLRTAVSK